MTYIFCQICYYITFHNQHKTLLKPIRCWIRLQCTVNIKERDHNCYISGQYFSSAISSTSALRKDLVSNLGLHGYADVLFVTPESDHRSLNR